jgi:DNA primase
MANIIVKILENFLGDHKKHNEDKCQVSFDCPACSSDKFLDHGDGKAKLEINYKKGVFKCWVCSYKNNMHGPIEKLISRYGNKTNLRDYILVKPESNYEAESYEDKEVHVALPKEFIPLTKSNGYEPKYYFAMKYLKDRGITDDIIKEFNIGYAHEGVYKNRVIIPSYDEFGDVNFFVARSFSTRTFPKYLNPEAEKQYIIFNHKKINFDATIYLVEGPFDHIVTPNSIPLLGKILSHKIKQLLLENAKADIVILLDDDAYEDAINIYKELDFGELNGRVKICKPPQGHDSSSIFERLGKKGIIKLLKNSRRLSEEEIY